MSIEFHRRMLADRVRHEAFRAALRAAIQPGASTVADIGAGSGVLAFFARELGAREVWLYDPGAALTLAQIVAERNGIDGLHFVPERSLDVSAPQQVDVVVAEVLGNFAYEEDVLETLRDAQRFLAPGGTLIPHSIVQWAAPVVADRFERDLSTWRDVGFGLDWSDAERMTRNNMYVFAIEPGDLLDDAALAWDALDFRGPIASRRAGSISWQPRDACRVFGFGSGPYGSSAAASRSSSSVCRSPTASWVNTRAIRCPDPTPQTDASVRFFGQIASTVTTSFKKATLQR